MKVSFHKTFLHFLVNQKNPHPSPTNLLVFFLCRFHFLETTKRGPDYASTGLSSAFPGCLPGWMGHVVCHVTDLSSRQVVTTASHHDQSCKARDAQLRFWDVFGAEGFEDGKKTYWEWQQNRSKFSFTYIYWYTHVINTHVINCNAFWKIIKNQQYIYYTLQNEHPKK